MGGGGSEHGTLFRVGASGALIRRANGTLGPKTHVKMIHLLQRADSIMAGLLQGIHDKNNWLVSVLKTNVVTR